MDPWGWIAVYAVGLAALQLLVYRYLLNGDDEVGYDRVFGDRDDRPDSATSGSDHGGSARPTGLAAASGRVERPREDADSRGRYCPRCETMNEPDPTFDRCWNCANRLA
ncbi:hypothetical protein NDI76_14450 [Halogeometricum sp. S1BR25-6]|uniref:DUF7577 domain-containing protein n=1 Tax=Halogeometricum salsisoli TaxID=2950536 RepID=A0ABU2GGN2_9EURY|nr:hypothetical protein [Halogeometricum sp. S1BR25-6]MDS0299945.1 hypothetical protein [Halogeometricum sp. S1BR25-6]